MASINEKLLKSKNQKEEDIKATTVKIAEDHINEFANPSSPVCLEGCSFEFFAPAQDSNEKEEQKQNQGSPRSDNWNVKPYACLSEDSKQSTI